MPLRQQKIKVFRGINSAVDALDIKPNQATDARNVVIDTAGNVATRKGYKRNNSSAYAGSITGLFDLQGITITPVQTANGYTRYLYSYIDDSGYLYVVNSSTDYDVNIGRSLVNQLNFTWETTSHELELRTPIIAGTSYTSTVTTPNTDPTVNTTRYNKTAMGTNSLTQRADPDFMFSFAELFDMSGGADLYNMYMTKVASDNHAHLFLDSCNADHTGYANQLDHDYGVTTGNYTFLTAIPYSATMIAFAHFTDPTTMYFGRVQNDGSNYASESYTDASYENINQVGLGYESDTGNMVGFYLKTTDMVTHDMYFCSVDTDGQNLSLETVLLDTDISFDIFDERLTVAVDSQTVYTAYCNNSGDLRLGTCTDTGTGFSYDVIDTNNCHSAQIFIKSSILYIVYSSYDGTGYKINVYRKDIS